MAVYGPMFSTWGKMASLKSLPLTHMEIQNSSMSLFAKKLTDKIAAGYIPSDARTRTMFTISLRMLDEMAKPRKGDISGVLIFSKECLEKEHFDAVSVINRKDEREFFKMALGERFPVLTDYEKRKLKKKQTIYPEEQLSREVLSPQGTRAKLRLR